MKQLIPKFLLYFVKRSRFAPPSEGEFVKTAEFGGKYVYQGRLLSREEFNALNGEVFEKERYTETVRAECLMVDAEPESDQGDDDTGEGDDTPATDSEGDEPKATASTQTNEEPATKAVDDSTPPVEESDPHAELRAELKAMPYKANIVKFAESKGVVVDGALTRDKLEAEVIRLLAEVNPAS